MGAFCCCLCPEDFEEHAYSSNSIYRHCICLRYFFHRLLDGVILDFSVYYTSLKKQYKSLIVLLLESYGSDAIYPVTELVSL